MTQQDIVLIGAGSMGGALLRGWVQKKLPYQFTVVEPDEAQRQALASLGQVKLRATLADASPSPAALVIAIKPQTMADALPDLAQRVKPGVVVSIAAGTPLAVFEKHWPGRAVVRAMPNLAAACAEAATALVANASADTEARALAEKLFSAVGTTAWLNDEQQIHAATALSGSGSAYVFHLVEALAEAGARRGLDPALATALARQTVIGAAALLKARAAVPAQALREAVTSPHGTTAAALEVLMGEQGLTALLDRALEAAAKRSEALAAQA